MMSGTGTWWTDGIRKGWIGRYETELVYFLREKYGSLTEGQQLVLVFLSLFLKSGHTTLPLRLSPKEWGNVIGLPPESVELLNAVPVDPESLIQNREGAHQSEEIHYRDEAADARVQNENLVSLSLEELTPLVVTEDRVSFRTQSLFETFITDWIAKKDATGSGGLQTDENREGSQGIAGIRSESEPQSGGESPQTGADPNTEQRHGDGWGEDRGMGTDRNTEQSRGDGGGEDRGMGTDRNTEQRHGDGWGENRGMGTDRNTEQSRGDGGGGVNYDPERISEELNRLYPEKSAEINWQKVATALSVTRPFTIISGGPGTGKTTTVANLLALHIRLADAPINIALAAPTGKAAGRMAEALQYQWSRIGLSDAEKSQIPAEARTIHRLLSGTEQRGLLPPARRKTLPYDLIVVDEASMIDLQLMYRLLYHIDERATLILLGDRNQLASVEAGSVFSDLCTKHGNSFGQQTAETLHRMGIEHDLPVRRSAGLLTDSGQAADSIVYLTKSYRYHEQSGIGQLSEAILSGGTDRVEELFSRYGDLHHDPFRFDKADLQHLADEVYRDYTGASAIAGAEDLLRYWKRTIRLTVLRHGPPGSQRLNSFAEQQIMLKRPGLVRDGWYHGRPFIITQNDYSLGIFNGDTGVAVLSGDGEMEAHVESGSGIKVFSPGQLTHIEPAYFLTVHKSQGSEFDHVHLLLPPADTQILSRELIYTAISRARKSFHLKGDVDLFKKGSGRKTERYTGL